MTALASATAPIGPEAATGIPPADRGPVPVHSRDKEGSERLEMVPDGGGMETWCRGAAGSRGSESGRSSDSEGQGRGRRVRRVRGGPG